MKDPCVLRIQVARDITLEVRGILVETIGVLPYRGGGWAMRCASEISLVRRSGLQARMTTLSNLGTQPHILRCAGRVVCGSMSLRSVGMPMSYFDYVYLPVLRPGTRKGFPRD